MGLCTSKKNHSVGSSSGSASQPTLDSLPSSYTLQQQIGAGGFGTVFLAHHKPSKQSVVAKRIPCQDPTRIPDEVRFMRDLQHPHIIRLLDLISLPSHHFLILELLPGAIDLFDFIDQRGRVSEKHARLITQQLASALSYLHVAKQLAHLDVKPENLLIQPGNGLVKLIDFGAAQQITEDMLTSFKGTRQYACPEILFQRCYDPVAADIWAVGVTLYKMVYGHLPFKRSRDYLSSLKIDSSVSSDCNDVLAILLHPNPLMRPLAMADVLNCLWVRT